MADDKDPKSNQPARQLNAAHAAKCVMRTVTELVDGKGKDGKPAKVARNKQEPVTEAEVLSFKDYGDHERERELDNMVKRDNMGHETRTAGTSTGTRQGIIEWLKGAGLDEALAEYVSKDFVDANGNVAYMDNGGQKK